MRLSLVCLFFGAFISLVTTSDTEGSSDENKNDKPLLITKTTVSLKRINGSDRGLKRQTKRRRINTAKVPTNGGTEIYTEDQPLEEDYDYNFNTEFDSKGKRDSKIPTNKQENDNISKLKGGKNDTAPPPKGIARYIPGRKAMAIGAVGLGAAVFGTMAFANYYCCGDYGAAYSVCNGASCFMVPFFDTCSDAFMACKDLVCSITDGYISKC